MAISDENKLYCVNNLIVMILNDLYELNPGIEPEVTKQKFIGSHTYELLHNFKTHLWAEGPDYIRNMFEEEKLL